MGLVKEPEGVDFIIQSQPLTDTERKEISEFICARKLEHGSMNWPSDSSTFVIARSRLQPISSCAAPY